MRYLITGGAGFIGSHLAAHLLREGHDVRLLDNFATGRHANVSLLGDDVELLEGGIQSYEQVTEAVAGCDAVFHQAALPSVPRSIRDPVASNTANVTGTLNVLLAARDNDTRRVVLASSSSVYGSAAGPKPKREDQPTLPISPYAASKLVGEGYARSFHSIYGLETVALRYFNVFGPRQDPNTSYAAVVPSFMTALLNGRAPVIFGDGEQSRDFTYVENVVHANMLAMDAPDAAGNLYNVGCGERVTLNQLVDLLHDMIGSDVPPTYQPTRAGDIRHSLADLSAAGRDLGYEPAVLVREGLQRTLDHFRDIELGSEFDAAPISRPR